MTFKIVTLTMSICLLGFIVAIDLQLKAAADRLDAYNHAYELANGLTP